MKIRLTQRIRPQETSAAGAVQMVRDGLDRITQDAATMEQFKLN